MRKSVFWSKNSCSAKLHELHQEDGQTAESLVAYLRLIGQEGDVDLRQSLDGFGSTALHQLIEQRIRAGWR